MKPTGLIWDFDGTLIDSQPGILASLRHCLERLELPPRSDDELRALIGVPLMECLRVHFGLEGERLEAGAEYYRERWYAGGMQQGVLYEGAEAVLARLHAAGVPMVLATAKLQPGAERALERCGLRRYFIAACGTYEGESDKHPVVGRALQALPEPARARPLMIGDRSYDAEAAAAHGIPFLGAGYGFGSADELAACACVGVCRSVDEILDHVL